MKKGRARFNHMNVVYLELLLYMPRTGTIPNRYGLLAWLLGRFRRLECGIGAGGFLCTIATIRDIVLKLIWCIL